MPAQRDGLHVEVATAVGSGARDEVLDLLDAAQEHDTYPGLSEESRLWLDDAGNASGASGASGVPDALDHVALLARLGSAGGSVGAGGSGGAGNTGVLAGAALLVRRFDDWTVETVVHPAHRQGAADVLGALVDAALAEAVTRGGGSVQVWQRSAGAGSEDAMAARGLAPVRELLQLRAPISDEAVHDASAPPVEVRPFRPGRDEGEWLGVNARAFSDHPEQGKWTLTDLERREREPWFDPGGFLLHEAGGRLAAFCWTRVHLSPVLGEIYVIGVDPDFQGRGLGRAMTRAGLGHLATRAVPTAMLYVESTNTAALVLYRSLGFTEHHREVVYRGVVPPSTSSDQVDAPTARPIP